MPTRSVSRGLAPVRPLPRRERADLDAVPFRPWGASRPMSWGEAFDANFTDGLVVLHRGAVVYERYAGCLGPTGRHAAMSLTKSLVGLLGEVLVAEGLLNERAPVRATLPELVGSAFGDATVRQVLDMTTALDYSEDYADPDARVWKHAAAGNALPKPAGYSGPRTYFEFLQTVERKGVHGQAFGYRTVNTDVLGWLISRASGKPLTEVMAERLWSRLGADGDRAAFARAGYRQLQGWSYRSMWWVSHDANGTYMARGVHGQSLWIDPAAGVVIARFASHPVAGNAANDATTLPAYQAISRHLRQLPPTARSVSAGSR